MGKYNYDKFINDLDFGNDNENYVADFLSDYLQVANYTENKSNSTDVLKQFDIFIEDKSGNKFTIEVKCDRHVATAGYDSKNIFIETENPLNGKPSGVNVSTAKYFITYFICLGEIWLIETTKLLELLAKNKGSDGMIFRKYCGDGNASGYTLSREVFRDYFTVFTEANGVIRVPVEVIQEQERAKRVLIEQKRLEFDKKSRKSAKERKKLYDSSDVLKNLFK